MKKRTIRLNFSSICNLLLQLTIEDYVEDLNFDPTFIYNLSKHLKAIKGYKGNEDKVIEMLSNHLAECNKFTEFTFLIER